MSFGWAPSRAHGPPKLHGPRGHCPSLHPPLVGSVDMQRHRLELLCDSDIILWACEYIGTTEVRIACFFAYTKPGLQYA